MEVKVNKNKNTVSFFDINRGEVFKFEDQFYMRTTLPTGGSTNAVCLEDGFLVQFYDTENVIKVTDAHVVVTE